MSLKIKIHPVFWLFALSSVVGGNYIVFLSALCSVIVHEYAHARSAYARGYILDTVTIAPYGAMLKGGEKIGDKDGIPIAAAGPIANFCICLALYALWWAFPSAYVYTKVLCDVNFVLGAFNVLPLYPLDGGRIIYAISKNKTRTLKAMKLSGMIFAGTLFCLYLASFFYTANHSLGVMAATLFASAVDGTEKETYKRLTDSTPYAKKFDAPIEKETVIVHWGLKLIRLLRQIKPDKKTVFEVVDDTLNTVRIFTENDIGKLCERYPLQCTLKELLSAYASEQGNLP